MPDAKNDVEQETISLNFYSSIPKGLMGLTAPSLHLAKLGLIVNAAVLPSGQEIPLVLYLAEPIPYG